MESFTLPCGGEEPGLVDLVTQADGKNVPVMTVEEVQRLGALDPVAVKIDEAKECLSMDNNEHGPKITQIIHQLKVTPTLTTTSTLPFTADTHVHTPTQVGDEDITALLGLRPTDRDRAMGLFSGGHIVTDSVRITTGKMRVGARQSVWIISGDVVASMRGRVYRTQVVFDQVHTHTQHTQCSLSLTHTHTHREQVSRWTSLRGRVNVWRTLAGAVTSWRLVSSLSTSSSCSRRRLRVTRSVECIPQMCFWSNATDALGIML